MAMNQAQLEKKLAQLVAEYESARQKLQDNIRELKIRREDVTNDYHEACRRIAEKILEIEGRLNEEKVIYLKKKAEAFAEFTPNESE